MLDIQRVLKQDRLLRAMTGLSRKAFEALLETFSRLYEAARQLVLSQAREGKLHDKRFHDEDDIAGHVPDAIPIKVA
ncbi:MAG: hypothetical protein ACAF41_27025 [Leptolyngbya sp. BL-A-14]